VRSESIELSIRDMGERLSTRRTSRLLSRPFIPAPEPGGNAFSIGPNAYPLPSILGIDTRFGIVGIFTWGGTRLFFRLHKHRHLRGHLGGGAQSPEGHPHRHLRLSRDLHRPLHPGVRGVHRAQALRTARDRGPSGHGALPDALPGGTVRGTFDDPRRADGGGDSPRPEPVSLRREPGQPAPAASGAGARELPHPLQDH
jgi:hypothetical protein